MPLAYLLDENLPGRFVRAIERHNGAGSDILDVVRLGEPDDLPLGSDDPTILSWAEREQRILVTEDKHTMPGHLVGHLAKGGHSPGVFLIRLRTTVPEVLEFLVLAAYLSEANEWQDQITRIP